MQTVEMKEEVTETKQPYAAPTLTTLMTGETHTGKFTAFDSSMLS